MGRDQGGSTLDHHSCNTEIFILAKIVFLIKTISVALCATITYHISLSTGMTRVGYSSDRSRP